MAVTDSSGLLQRFKALSDKTRLRLFCVLQQYELNVNEIVLVVGMIQSGVSRHLKILLDSGLVWSRKDGSFTYYSIARNQMAQTLADIVAKAGSDDPVFVQDLESAKEMIRVRQNRTRRFFKSVAPKWERLKKEVMGDLDLNGKILAGSKIQGRVADLGCGTGDLMERLLAAPCEKLIGIDSSPEMLNQARRRLNDHPLVELRLGELEYLPMKNKEIDTAVMNMVLHHTSVPKLPIDEVYRVLKKQGRFILSDFEKHDKEMIKEIVGGSWLGFEKQEVSAWLTQAGFDVIRVETFPIMHDLAINLYFAEKNKREQGEK